MIAIFIKPVKNRSPAPAQLLKLGRGEGVPIRRKVAYAPRRVIGLEDQRPDSAGLDLSYAPDVTVRCLKLMAWRRASSIQYL